ncbi:MAG: hypothetical protein CL908_03660 [Deltaproteobacteria bacterium]|nr:hypothetical protein [Deltaproteobacteria bacterium]
MIALAQASGIALLWFALVSLALIVCASIERRTRVLPRPDRPELDPLRAAWGGDREMPAASHLLLRAIAGGARMVRARTILADRPRTLRGISRIVSCAMLAGALSLVPFAGTWGGRQSGVPFVAVDLPHGLVALVFLILLAAMAQVAIGLGDRSVWSRLASVRIASRTLASLGLLVLVLTPLALEAGSLRLHDIVAAQQDSFQPLAWLSASVEGELSLILRAWRWPNWNVFAQPLTALLFLASIGLSIRRPLAWDAMSGTVGASGLGLDGDPFDLYWARTETRLSRVLAVTLFVSLFLGAGAIPFFDPGLLVERLEPLVGPVLPSLLVLAVQLGVFFAKVWLVLAAVALLRRATGVLRDDQTTRLVTRRLLPIAWANLLLMAAITLLSEQLLSGQAMGGG